MRPRPVSPLPAHTISCSDCCSAPSQQQTAPRLGVAIGLICRACSINMHTSSPVLRVLPTHRVVGNCVAGRNHRYFAGFLIAGQLGCLFCLAGAIWRLRQKGLPTCVRFWGFWRGRGCARSVAEQIQAGLSYRSPQLFYQRLAALSISCSAGLQNAAGCQLSRHCLCLCACRPGTWMGAEGFLLIVAAVVYGYTATMLIFGTAHCLGIICGR